MRPRIAIAALAIVVAVGLLGAALARSSGPDGHTAQAAAEQRTTVPSAGDALLDPIDRRYLTALRFGRTSFWLQPWRAYMDTWPAARLDDALGINFNVAPAQAPAVARLLHDSGFKLARIELGWGGLSYTQPTRFVHEASVQARLTALHNYGLRPLILLNANSGAPCPAKQVALDLTAQAPAGANTIALSPSSAAAVVPGKTGLDARALGLPRRRPKRARARAAAARQSLTPQQRLQRKAEKRARHRAEARQGIDQLVRMGNPAILITAVSATGVATLSRPLPATLAAGAHPATTLLYAPFQAPTLPGGAANPAFAATLHGWLNYVATVSRKAQSIFGPGGYDLEVWNELGFGSQFLDAGNYYASGVAPSAGQGEAAATEAASEAAEQQSEAQETAREEAEQKREEEKEAQEAEREEQATASDVAAKPHGAGTHTARAEVTRAVTKALLAATVAYVRDPANGISPEVGISDGFASQSPFFSAAYAPAGLTAYSKHPYVGPKTFPAEYRRGHGAIPVDALGQRDTVGTGRSPEAHTARFVPDYQSLLPEAALTATSGETLSRDLAPFTTSVYKAPHGRRVHPPHSPAPQMWITEYNLGTGHATPVGPDGSTPEPVTLTPPDKEHFQAKALLRSLTATINKGATREYFFAAAPGALSLINPAFYTALHEHPNTYPGDQLGGETLRALHNLTTHIQGPGPEDQPHQLKLTTIAQNGNHAQFTGDGTTAHPNLYDRDVLAVLPFQTSPTSFAIPIYVMTRDLLTLYQPQAPPNDIQRFDLPNETFRITLTNLPTTTTPPTITAYDPLTNTNTPAHLINQTNDTATIEIAATDYPRILTINYRRSGA